MSRRRATRAEARSRSRAATGHERPSEHQSELVGDAPMLHEPTALEAADVDDIDLDLVSLAPVTRRP